MWIVISLLNVLLAFFAEKNYDVNKVKCKFFLILIIVANVVVWGLRDIGVGTDTITYIDSYFRQANTLHNFDDVIFNDTEEDKGFLAIAWLSTSLGSDSRILMFLTELFVITFIVLGLYEFKKTLNYSITWFMIFFVLLYQHETINLMRQFCAMALLFYGYSLFLQKKYIIFLLFQILAYFFHPTSLLFLMIPLAQLLSQTKGGIKYMYILFAIIVGLCFLFMYFILLPYMENLGLLKEVYFDAYGKGSRFESTNVSFGISAIFPYLILLAIIYFLYSKKYLPDDLLYMLLFLVVMDFIFRLSSVFVMRYFFRLAFYMGIIMIVYLSIVVKQNILILRMLGLAYSFAILFIIVRTISVDYYGQNDIITNRNDNNLIYKSKILGIDESK